MYFALFASSRVTEYIRHTFQAASTTVCGIPSAPSWPSMSSSAFRSNAPGPEVPSRGRPTANWCFSETAVLVSIRFMVFPKTVVDYIIYGDSGVVGMAIGKEVCWRCLPLPSSPELPGSPAYLLAHPGARLALQEPHCNGVTSPTMG